MPVQEVLPIGVGRVPQWWMDIAPHYTLDEDDIGERRKAEDQMAFYYMQLAAADEAGVLLPDGTPKLGPDLKPLSWTPITPWNRIDSNTNGDNTTGLGPGGRNFKPGHAVIDPKLFGILENDPDYHSYLTGAKLPPGYFEKMGELAQSELGGTEGILNNLKQTDYGRYGRQAEAPNFKPAWAKKKLRSTETGGKIRQGEYNDSPNKFLQQRRRVESKESLPQLPSSRSIYSEASSSTTNLTTTPALISAASPPPSSSSSSSLTTQNRSVAATSIHDKMKSLRIDTQNDTTVVVPTVAVAIEDVNNKKTMIRKVRKVRKSASTPTSVFMANKKAAAEEESPALDDDDDDDDVSAEGVGAQMVVTKPNGAADVTIAQQQAELALLMQQQEKLQRLQELQRQQELLRLQQEKEKHLLLLREQEQRMAAAAAAATTAKASTNPTSHVDNDDDASYVEEVVDEDYSEGSYEEEVIYDDDDDAEEDHLELNDLQAILAAKQAELLRLTQQMQ